MTNPLTPQEALVLRSVVLAYRFKPSAAKEELRALLRRLGEGGADFEALRPAAAALSVEEWRTSEATLRRAEQLGVRVLGSFDEEYPALLRDLEDFPLALFVRGSLPRKNAFAVVGARKASTFGKDIAENISQSLSRAGIDIVSGLALGIDGAAHKGALRGENGPGAAILGSGVFNIYPPRHAALAEELLSAGGGIVSEYGLDTAPRDLFFPERNRLISALSCAVLVVEAQARSGALITGRLAAEQGRTVFALPGSINNPLAKGTNFLIKCGADLFTGIEDLLSLYPQLRDEVALPRPGGRKKEDGPHARLLALLDLEEERGFDALVEQSGLDAAELARLLTELELAGRVTSLPGGLFVKNRVVDLGR